MARPAIAQGPQNVLVVINDSSPDSRDVGEYYLQKRQIPAANTVRVQLPVTDEIDRATYQTRLELPLVAWFRANAAWDRILYIVLTKGVPLRITGTQGTTGTIASVDSELTLLYRKMLGFPIVIPGPIRNPYHAAELTTGGPKPFTHDAHDIFLVTRLDGFTRADAKGLVDRSLAAARSGGIVLDGRIELGQKSLGSTWLEQAAAALRKLRGWGERVTLDTGGRRAGQETKLLGYYSWGSNDTMIQVAGAPDLSFGPGALAAMFVSSDARTFRQPPDGWRPGSKTDFAGSNQSLTGELVRQGVTGAAGHVAEPTLVASIRPDILFPAYVSGLNLAESFYAAMPYLSWQTVVLGDPLCAPFKQNRLEQRQIDPGVDLVSELPVFFTNHRVGSPARGEVKVDAWKLLFRAEHLVSTGNTAGAKSVLERAATTDDRLVAAHLALAAMAQGRGDWDEAIGRYRRVLTHTPYNVTALNDLAYLLAERKRAPEEALPLATKAYALAEGQPHVADTLAWIQHLLGRDATAVPLIRQAAKQLPRSAEIQFHLAAILAATGDVAGATAALDAVVKLDPALGERPDVRALRTRLQPAR